MHIEQENSRSPRIYSSFESGRVLDLERKGGKINLLECDSLLMLYFIPRIGIVTSCVTSEESQNHSKINAALTLKARQITKSKLT